MRPLQLQDLLQQYQTSDSAFAHFLPVSFYIREAYNLFSCLLPHFANHSSFRLKVRIRSMSHYNMSKEFSRCAFFFSLILFMPLADCGVWENIGWNPVPDSDPGDPPQPTLIPPNLPFTENQSVPPSPIYSPGCQTSLCTLSVSVSPFSVACLLRNSKMRFSPSLYTIGLKSPQTRLVWPRFPANPQPQFPMV